MSLHDLKKNTCVLSASVVVATVFHTEPTLQRFCTHVQTAAVKELPRLRSHLLPEARGCLKQGYKVSLHPFDLPETTLKGQTNSEASLCSPNWTGIAAQLPLRLIPAHSLRGVNPESAPHYAITLLQVSAPPASEPAQRSPSIPNLPWERARQPQTAVMRMRWDRVLGAKLSSRNDG